MSNLQTLQAEILKHEQSYSREELQREFGKSPDCPKSADRNQLATWLAIQHMAIDSDITDVYYLPSSSPGHEIRLLEVNRQISRFDDEVEAVNLGFEADEFDYQLFVADISESEHERLRLVGIPLPDGWMLEGAWHWMKR